MTKVENNEKPINRQHLATLSKFFKVQEDELQTLWLTDKIRLIIQYEPYALSALNILIKGIEGNENN